MEIFRKGEKKLSCIMVTIVLIREVQQRQQHIMYLPIKKSAFLPIRNTANEPRSPKANKRRNNSTYLKK